MDHAYLLALALAPTARNGQSYGAGCEREAEDGDEVETHAGLDLACGENGAVFGSLFILGTRGECVIGTDPLARLSIKRGSRTRKCDAVPRSDGLYVQR